MMKIPASGNKPEKTNNAVLRSFTRLTLLTVTAVGLAACNHTENHQDSQNRQSRTPQRITSDHKTTVCCGTFTPKPYTPATTYTIVNLGPNYRDITVPVEWDTVGDCRLTEGKVTLYLLKKVNGVWQVKYTGQQDMVPQAPGTSNYQAVTVRVPLDGIPYSSTGMHYVRRCVIGKFSDGCWTGPQHHSDFPCPGHP